MRIIVISDTHGRTFNLKKVCQKQSSADVFIHLGDGISDLDSIKSLYPNIAFISVKGNVDFGINEQFEKLLVLEEKRIFLCHGHKYGVKGSLESFLAAARNAYADIALFGHTHNAFYSFSSGMYIMNPGSLERPVFDSAKFGIIDIQKGTITAYLSDV